MAKKINKAGLDLIKHFEGYFAKAYLCPANVWTIGYGHIKGVKKGDVITLAQAEQFLIEDLEEAATAVEELVRVPLTSNQFAALVSFTFNLGRGNLSSSTLLKVLNAGKPDNVPSEMAKWVKGGGKVLAGLVRRRAAEGELWLTPDSGKLKEGGMPQAVEEVG